MADRHLEYASEVEQEWAGEALVRHWVEETWSNHFFMDIPMSESQEHFSNSMAMINAKRRLRFHLQQK
jgi:hypothetical protein